MGEENNYLPHPVVNIYELSTGEESTNPLSYVTMRKHKKSSRNVVVDESIDKTIGSLGEELNKDVSGGTSSMTHTTVNTTSVPIVQSNVATRLLMLESQMLHKLILCKVSMILLKLCLVCRLKL